MLHKFGKIALLLAPMLVVSAAAVAAAAGDEASACATESDCVKAQSLLQQASGHTQKAFSEQHEPSPEFDRQKTKSVRDRVLDYFLSGAGSKRGKFPSMLQTTARCEDRPTGVLITSYGQDLYGLPPSEIGCPELVEEKGCNDTDFWYTIHANCPVSCHLCEADGALPECYPHQCGAGGGPWLTKTGADSQAVINYFFDDEVSYGESAPNADRKASFRLAADEWEAISCIRFVEAGPSVPPPRLAVIVGDETICNTGTGFPGYNGTITLNLGSCGRTGERDGSVVHELGHLIGMNHEHVRPDAAHAEKIGNVSSGPFLTINWKNIDNMHIQYEKDDMGYAGSQSAGVKPYDYESIMHYNNYPESNGGTAFTLPADAPPVGQREAITNGDAAEVRDMYQCTPSGSVTVGSWTAGDWGMCMHWCEAPLPGPIGHWQAVREEWCTQFRPTCMRSRTLSCSGEGNGQVAPHALCEASETSANYPLVEECDCPSPSCDEADAVYLLHYPPHTGTVENHGVFASCTDALEEYDCDDTMWGDQLTRDCPRHCGVEGCPPPEMTTTTTTTIAPTTTQPKRGKKGKGRGESDSEPPCEDSETYIDFTSRQDPCSEWKDYDCTLYGENSLELVKNCPKSCGVCD